MCFADMPRLTVLMPFLVSISVFGLKIIVSKNKLFETKPVEVMSVVVKPMLTTLDTLVCLTVYFFSNFGSKISNFDYFSTFHQNCISILVTLIIFG